MRTLEDILQDYAWELQELINAYLEGRFSSKEAYLREKGELMEEHLLELQEFLTPKHEVII